MAISSSVTRSDCLRWRERLSLSFKTTHGSPGRSFLPSSLTSSGKVPAEFCNDKLSRSSKFGGLLVAVVFDMIDPDRAEIGGRVFRYSPRINAIVLVHKVVSVMHHQVKL